MTLFLDSSALLARYVEGDNRTLVVQAMADDPQWCASALALTETTMLLERLGLGREQTVAVVAALQRDWSCIHVVPVDQRCLDRATAIGREQPVRTLEAIQLAAADRLPRPLGFATFDPNLIGPALALGFRVVSAESAGHPGARLLP